MSLKATQIELGNVFTAINYRGEKVLRRLVGGDYGSVTKFFLIDPVTSELKSRKRDTEEEVLEGFEILAIHSADMVATGTEKGECEVGDFFYFMSDDNGLEVRQLVGGHAYDEDIYFAIDPRTGKRCSRTKETIEEVLENYEIELILG